MKAMIIKDCKIIFSGTKYYLFLMVLFTLIGAFNRGYSIFQFYPVLLMAMLPITAMAYDERSQWNPYGLTMPCSRRDMVLGKYIIGILGSILMGLLNLVLDIVVPLLITHTSVDPVHLSYYMICVIAASIIFLDLNLPLMFRFGTEKGRIFYLCAMVVVIAIPTVFNSVTSVHVPFLNALYGLIAITLLLTVASMTISIRIFRKKEF